MCCQFRLGPQAYGLPGRRMGDRDRRVGVVRETGSEKIFEISKRPVVSGLCFVKQYVVFPIGEYVFDINLAVSAAE